MSKTEIIISSDGTLIKPIVHDAQLIGLLALDDISAILLIIKGDNASTCFLLSGTEQFKCDNFLKGNIILDITIETGLAVDFEKISDLFEYPTDKNSVYIQNLIKRLTSKELFLVTLNPSYGCSFVCICKKIKVIENCLDFIRQHV